jgi:hypothetical protein
MKELFEKLLAKVKENKETLIRVGLGLAGAVAGAIVATAIANNQEDSMFHDEEELENHLESLLED